MDLDLVSCILYAKFVRADDFDDYPLIQGYDAVQRTRIHQSVGSGLKGTSNPINTPFRFSSIHLNQKMSNMHISTIGAYFHFRHESTYDPLGGTFTFFIVSIDDIDQFSNFDLISQARRKIEVTIVHDTWDEIVYHRVIINEELYDHETILFGAPSDTISPVYYQNLPIGDQEALAFDQQHFIYGTSHYSTNDTFIFDFDINTWTPNSELEHIGSNRFI
jgi:hypothetical protein